MVPVTIFENFRVRRLEKIVALNLALEGNREEISKEESESTIVSNLVSVEGRKSIGDGYVDTNKGNGLLITTDGFILTAYHIIEQHLDDWKKIKDKGIPRWNFRKWAKDIEKKYHVFDQNGNRYPIDITWYAKNSSLDIALIKAIIPRRKPRPIMFRILEDELQSEQVVKLVGLQDDVLSGRYGKVKYNKINAPNLIFNDGEKTISDSFLTTVQGGNGMSGGVYITENGELAGIHIYGIKNGDILTGDGGGVRMRNVLKLVKKAVYSFNKNYLLDDG
ncbi:MAG TPA: serine protease [Candidatus Nanoarchaeia archaeon]|nr:serine protease [Candidatus Nanoarchaeia archaeon]